MEERKELYEKLGALIREYEHIKKYAGPHPDPLIKDSLNKLYEKIENIKTLLNKSK